MADLAYRNEPVLATQGSTNWGAIWAGVFTFVAIWSVFGLLGEAIFATAANPTAAQPVSGMDVGMGIWGIILTIIAMYIAGRVTGRLANVADKGAAVMYGMTMFGLCIVATLLVIVFGGTALSGGTGIQAGPHSPYMLTVFADIGWIGFVALFLGWLSAMGGAASALKPRAASTSNVRDIRPAA